MVFLSYHNKILQIGWLKQCFLMDIKSKVKVLSGLVPEKGSLFGLQMAAFLFRPHMAFHSFVWRESSSSSCKTTSPMRLGPRPYDLI